MQTTSPYVVRVIAAQRREEVLRAAADRRLARRLPRRSGRTPGTATHR